MKRTSLLATALLALGFVFLTTGCASFSSPPATAVRRPNTYALIVSVSGGQAPTDAQWATMQKKFGALLASRGLVLVTDPSQAEQLIQVLFVPDLDDPTTGVSYIVGLRTNPANVIASEPRTIPSTGYGYASTTNYAFTGMQPQYYGYFPDYADNTNPSTPAAASSRPTPTPTPTPGHVGGHHTTRPVDCPPDEPRRPPSDYAANHSRPSNPSSDGGHWWSSHPRSDPGTSGSSSSSSPSSYSSSSSDSVGPSTSYSSSASNSSPSISFSSDSSSSSPSFSGSSGSSSSTGVSSGESTGQKP